MLTHIILTPGACGGGVRAAVLDTTSATSTTSADNNGRLVLVQRSMISAFFLENDVQILTDSRRRRAGIPKDHQREPKGVPREPNGHTRVHTNNIQRKIHNGDSAKEKYIICTVT